MAFVSSVDTFLTIHLKETLPHFERNPIAKMILEADNWNIARFIGLKMFGTIFVLGIVTLIYTTNRLWSFITVIVIAILQTILLLYLSFG